MENYIQPHKTLIHRPPVVSKPWDIQAWGSPPGATSAVGGDSGRWRGPSSLSRNIQEWTKRGVNGDGTGLGPGRWWRGTRRTAGDRFTWSIRDWPSLPLPTRANPPPTSLLDEWTNHILHPRDSSPRPALPKIPFPFSISLRYFPSVSFYFFALVNIFYGCVCGCCGLGVTIILQQPQTQGRRASVMVVVLGPLGGGGFIFCRVFMDHMHKGYVPLEGKEKGGACLQSHEIWMWHKPTLSPLLIVSH